MHALALIVLSQLADPLAPAAPADAPAFTAPAPQVEAQTGGRWWSIVTPIAGVALYALSTGVVGYEVYRFQQDVAEVCRNGIRVGRWF
ncbi:MAG: hypothetical protein JNK82_20190 [Myxococcaceae bacterium]|nr:hypothetical protein [Myxococcaceae bacterium]